MPRRGSPYGGAYARAARRLRDVPTPCQLRFAGVCTGRATGFDHQPALVEHHHVEGSGCCRWVPACGPCNTAKGGWRLANARRGIRARTPLVQAPRPTRLW